MFNHVYLFILTIDKVLILSAACRSYVGVRMYVTMQKLVCIYMFLVLYRSLSMFVFIVYCLCGASLHQICNSFVSCFLPVILSVVCSCSMWVRFSQRAADCGTDYVCCVCTDHDGCHRGYHTAAGGGRRWLPLSHLPHISLRILLHSSLHAPTGIQVHYSRSAVSSLYSLHVPSPHYLLPHQSQQCLMGDS